ncbi:hypothetical protein ACX0G9_25865 [Flavitalea flava]
MKKIELPCKRLGEATPLEDIQLKVYTFYEKMRRIAQFLKDNNAPPEMQIDPENLKLEFYIDKKAITRLINICMQDNFAIFGVFFGLQDPKDQQPLKGDAEIFGELTGCFLGLDDDRNILGCHFPKIPVGTTKPVVVMGEDTWPPHPPKPIPPVATGSTAQTPRYFSLASNPMDVCKYFQTDVSAKVSTGSK